MSAAPGAPHPPTAARGAVLLAVGTIVGLLGAGVVLYYLVESLQVVPPSYQLLLRIAFVVAVGLLAVVIVGRVLLAAVGRWAGAKHAGLIHSAYRLVAYTVLAVVVLYSAGVNGYALLAGGTFAGLVLGLASQTALANFVAGVVLLSSRPFEPGDRVTFVSSSYSFLLPSYPPKFFSQDLLMPGFTGVVEDIGLVFTDLRLDDGPKVTLPNSLVIGAAIVGHSLAQRWVRLKYEVPPAVDPATLLPKLVEAVRTCEWVVRPELVQAYVNQATLTSYVVSVDALCRGNLEEPPRSALYLEVMRVVREESRDAVRVEAPTERSPSSPKSDRPAADRRSSSTRA
jgi:small conductance mechanosensitive channel